MAEKVELCAADDVLEGAAVKVESHGLTLAVFNVDDTGASASRKGRVA